MIGRKVVKQQKPCYHSYYHSYYYYYCVTAEAPVKRLPREDG
jgi:hypothetical protein